MLWVHAISYNCVYLWKCLMFGEAEYVILRSYRPVPEKLTKISEILWAPLLYYFWNLNIKVKLQKVVQMNIKHFIQLFLQLFIDGDGYYYYGPNAFMCIWITTLSLLQEYQALQRGNPQRIKISYCLTSLTQSFKTTVMQHLAHAACSNAELVNHLKYLFRILNI